MRKLQEVALWLRDAKRAVAFTGAGISTESGIPDFRSPGGIWSQSKPVYFQEFLASAEARYEYWRQKSASHREFFDAQPNVGHRMLAKWENEGRLVGVVTQNIDGLHQIAGNKRVFELHGTAREVACLDCEARFEADAMVRRFLDEDRVPNCPHCQGLLKHATISFGQNLPQDVLAESINLARTADLFLAIGSSLVVEPAASLPRIAAQSGAKLVIVNREATPQDALASAVLSGSIGETLAAMDAAIPREGHNASKCASREV